MINHKGHQGITKVHKVNKEMLYGLSEKIATLYEVYNLRCKSRIDIYLNRTLITLILRMSADKISANHPACAESASSVFYFTLDPH